MNNEASPMSLGCIMIHGVARIEVRKSENGYWLVMHGADEASSTIHLFGDDIALKITADPECEEGAS